MDHRRTSGFLLAAALLASVALPAHAGKIYWTDPGITPGRIYRADLSGAHTEIIYQGSGTRGIAVDVAGGKIYWAEAGKIRRAELDGSQPMTVVGGANVARGLALDLVHGYVYWTEYVGVRRCRLDGSELLNLSPFGSSGVALDVPAGKLYFAEGGIIRRTDLDGSYLETLVTGQPTIGLMDLDLLHGKIYWTGGGIHRANL